MRLQELCVHVKKEGGGTSMGFRLPAATLCLVIVSIIIIIIIIILPQSVLGQGQCPPITAKVLILDVTDLPTPPYFATSLFFGFDASLRSRNYAVGDGVTVSIIRQTGTMEKTGEAVETALQTNPDIFIVAIILGDTAMRSCLSTLKQHNLMSFAPFIGSSSALGWDPSMYLVRADPLAELFTLLRYTVSFLRFHRIGFMYLQGVSFGEVEYTKAVSVMSRLGMSLCGVFTVKSSLTGAADAAEFDAAWEKFADTLPQVCIVFGSPLGDTAKFLSKMLTDKRTANAYLLAPSGLQTMILSVWKAAVNLGVPFVRGLVITTGTNPLAKETSYQAIRKFQPIMEDYLKNVAPSGSTVGKDFPNNDEEGELMVAGWIAGEVLVRSMASRQWIQNRTAYAVSAFDQRRYVINNLVIGDYGGECSGVAASQGAMCYCNNGGRTVYVKHFVENFKAEPIVDATLSFRTSECSASESMVISTLNGVAFLMIDSTHAVWATGGFSVGLKAAVDANTMIDPLAFVVHNVTTTVADAAKALRAEMSVRVVDAVGAVVTEAMLDVEDVVFIDPILLVPHVNKFRRNVIILSPTLAQQFFVVAQYLGGGSEAHAVIRGAEANIMSEMLRKSMVTFGGSLKSTAILKDSDTLVDHLPNRGDVFVVGLMTGDIDAIMHYMEAHDGLRVIVAFSEFALQYVDFVGAFATSSAADRLLFATSLPHWADVTSASEAIQQFIAAVPDRKERTPLSLMGFIYTRLVQLVRSRMDKVSAKLFADIFYEQVAFTDGDMLYGPYSDGTPCDPVDGADTAKGCGVNYGATRISVWSFARVSDPSVAPLSAAVTPSMVYVEPVKSGLSTEELIGVIVGSIAAGLLIVALVVVLFYCCRDSRDNANAPKEPTDPVTLVFTDIESSTALWAACPELMPDAVATHHRLIRALITKYRCYEVKTIGDSFMIACKSPFAAVQLAGELQRVFLHHDWGTSAIDDAYHRFEEDRAAEDDEYVPPTARLDAAVYEQYWRGLRVRVGMHTGLADIRHDEVTKGYDYYGGTSNTAARTESVGNGGQVLMTRATYLALSTAEREKLEVTALGAAPLRGVPKPVEMYQLDAVPGRTFAALRLDKEVPDLEDSSEMPSGEDVSVHSAHSSLVQSIITVFTAAFGTFVPPQRLKALIPLCERWNVRLPRRDTQTRDEDCCRVAIERLAVKLGNVLERKGNAGLQKELSFTLSGGAAGLGDTMGSHTRTLSRKNTSVVHLKEAASQRGSMDVQSVTGDEAFFVADDGVFTVRARRRRK